MMSKEITCCKMVSNGPRTVSFHRCYNAAKHVHEGKPYCTVHYPPNVEKRVEESTARWNAKHEREMKPLHRASMFTDLVSALRDLAPGKMLPEDAPCHYGLVSQDKCANCQRIKRALDLLKQAEQYE